MLIPRVLLAPHVSTLLLDERRRHRTEMLEAYAAAALALEAERPEVIVALSARWEAPGPFLVDAARRHGTLTDYYGFGVEVRYDCHGEPKLAAAIVAAAQAVGVRAGTTTRGVDSGVSVPLHFLAARRLYPVVPVSLGAGPAAAHRAWGRALRQAIDASPGRVAFVVGGMLSHNVHAWNLRRDTPEAQDFDRRALEALGGGAWDELARLAMRRHVRACPEANLMHLEVLHGLLGADLPGRLLCYEPGPGVGAALVEFLAGEPAALPGPVAGEVPAAKRDPRLHVPVRVEHPLQAREVRRPKKRAAARRPARPQPKPGAGPRVRPDARPGGRPSVRPGGRPYTRPGERPGPRPAGRPNVRPGGRPDARPGSRPYTRPGERPGPRPAGRPYTRPGERPDARPGSRPYTRPAGRPDARPGSRPYTRPAGRPDARPGSRPYTRPGERPGTRPAGRPGTRPGGRPDARPGSRPYTRPGGRPDPRPGGRPNTRPGGRPPARKGPPRGGGRGPRPGPRPTRG